MLPFITPPAPTTTRRIGNDTSGVLEMEERGGLTVGESALIQELLANEQSSFVRGAQIADQIATDEGISITEAFQIIEKAISGQPMEEAADAIRVKNAERINEVARVYSVAGMRSTEATVTALIRSRLNLPEWGLEDTRKLPRALFDGIWALAQDEQKAEEMPSSPPTADELGKPPAEPGKSRKPTGMK